jgi:hypothetical protein
MSVIVRPYPTATTSKGIILANLSSPHQFRFNDGTILPACLPDRSRLGSLDTKETERPGIKGTTDVLLYFGLSKSVSDMLDEIHTDDAVDIVIVPFPVMQCIKNEELLCDYPKARVIRMADRVEKIAFHDKFCV